MPAQPQRPSWAPQHEFDDLADKTARISILELQYKHLDRKLDSQSASINTIDQKLDALSTKITDQQFSELREQHHKEIEAVKNTAEVTSKVKLLWAAGGVIITAVIAIIVAIMKYRFGG